MCHNDLIQYIGKKKQKIIKIHKKYIRATCKHARVQSKTTAMEMDYETDDLERKKNLNSAFE